MYQGSRQVFEPACGSLFGAPLFTKNLLLHVSSKQEKRVKEFPKEKFVKNLGAPIFVIFWERQIRRMW